MSKTTHLLLTVLTLTGFCCLWGLGAVSASAATLEPTDSGAPSATVMFPVSDKPAGAAFTMKPTVFNHLAHEKKVSNCTSCHHTDDPVACSTCHTLEGKAEGNFITLERAMHAENILKRADGTTPQSCVSCHSKRAKTMRNCAGCHASLKPVRDAAYCATCHTGSPALTPDMTAKGMKGELDASQKEALAAPVVLNKKPTALLTGSDGPYRVQIDSLVEHYQPNRFNHKHHVDSLMARIKKSNLAAAFHNKPEILCSTCHHQSPLSATPPKCASCHSPRIDPNNPERPHLKAAYHQLCMGCHREMQVARPRATDCATCHKRSPARVAQ